VHLPTQPGDHIVRRVARPPAGVEAAKRTGRLTTSSSACGGSRCWSATYAEPVTMPIRRETPLGNVEGGGLWSPSPAGDPFQPRHLAGDCGACLPQAVEPPPRRGYFPWSAGWMNTPPIF